MHDPQTFESRLTVALRRYVEDGPQDIDAMALAVAIANDVRTRRSRNLTSRLGVPSLAHPSKLLVVALVVAVVAASAVLVGSQLLRQSPGPLVPPDRGVFTPTGSMTTLRHSGEFTATLLRDGRVLVVGGAGSTSAETWDPATGLFTQTGSLAEPRSAHTATLLDDGRVLVVGGRSGDSLLDNLVEIWDPDTGAFTVAGSLDEARQGHTATRLRDGRVLVVGGSGDAGSRGSAEIWDTGTRAFTRTGSLAEARAGHTATLLRDGRVLVVGGSALATAELWDPVTEAFTGTGSLVDQRTCGDSHCSPGSARMLHAATLLADGRVLVTGGTDGQLSAIANVTAEVWDPDTGTFSMAGSMAEGRRSLTATLLADGRVLVVGGSDAFQFPVSRDSAEIWDPATSSFSRTGSLAEARSAHTATRLSDGRVIVIGGEGKALINGTDGRSAEVFQLQR